MRVGLFGGAGFIGGHVARRLILAGHQCVVFDQRGKPGIIRVDLSKPNELEAAIASSESLDAAVWLAASIQYERDINLACSQDIDLSVNAPLHALHALHALREIKSFVYLSSIEVYGAAQYEPIDENHPTEPEFPYGVAKLSGEYFLKIACAKFGVPLTILRLSYVYGPGQHPENVIPRFIEGAKSGKPPIVYTGADKRDDVYVGDVADAVTRSLSDGFSGTLTIASGAVHSLFDVAKTVCEVAGNGLHPIRENRPSAWIDRSFDISRAKTELAYSPTPFRNGIAAFWDAVS